MLWCPHMRYVQRHPHACRCRCRCGALIARWAFCTHVQRRKDNEDSILAAYISQLCISGKLCTEEAPRRRAMLHAMRAHEARVAARKHAAGGHHSAETATTALSLTHLRTADPAAAPPAAPAAPATVHMHDAYPGGHAAPRAPAAVPGLSAQTVPITTGAVGWNPGQDSTARAGAVPVVSGRCAPASQSAPAAVLALPQPSHSPPLTLDSMLSMNRVSLDLQQQLEGLFKMKCMGGNGADAHSTAAAAAAAKCATDNPEAALSSMCQDGWMGWPPRSETPQPKASASATSAAQQSWLRAVSSMQDLQALEQLQKSRSSAPAAGTSSMHAGVRFRTARCHTHGSPYTRRHCAQYCMLPLSVATHTQHPMRVGAVVREGPCSVLR